MNDNQTVTKVVHKTTQRDGTNNIEPGIKAGKQGTTGGMRTTTTERVDTNSDAELDTNPHTESGHTHKTHTQKRCRPAFKNDAETRALPGYELSGPTQKVNGSF
jgi:hypothetical protein